jgi:predicted ATPase
MEHAQSLLESTRLLTLTGPGGTGKTRLALELAAVLGESFDDGVDFVPLAGITDHHQVAAKILEAFPDHVTDAAASIEDQLQAYLAARSVLLVLDNFEQVIDAAPLVGNILEASPGTTIVVTSRVSLQIAGEQEMPVLPLAVPASGAVAGGVDARAFDSIDLFVDRARAVRPSFSVDDDTLPTLVELVSKLDGLPLAIELAASRVRTLSPRAILDNLSHVMASGGRRDVPVRQQTMHNTIAWSYDLLPEPGKDLLALMSTFAAGAGFDEIETVAGPRLGDELLGAIETLAEHSLIRSKEQGDVLRFLMLETVRQFGLEQLTNRGMFHEAKNLHAQAYSRLITAAEPHLTGSDSGHWLDILSADHDNIRAALHWAVTTGDLDLAYQMASSLWRFFHMRGLLFSARELLNDLLARPGASAPARAKALEAAGGVAYWSGDMDEAYAYYEEALELARRTGDLREIANGLYNLGFARNYAGGSEEARKLFEEAHEIFAEIGDRPGMAAATWGLGDAWTASGELIRARECFEHSIAEFEQLDDPFSLGWALYTQGEILVRLGEYENAREHLERGLALLDSTDISAIVMFLAAFASLELAGGDRERGVRLAGAMSFSRAT